MRTKIFFIIGLLFFLSACTKNSSNTQIQSPANTIWVGKSNEAKSCENKKGLDIDLMSKELENVGIKIIARKLIPENTPTIQGCGVNKGDLNGYLISKDYLNKAEELGFKQIQSTLQP